MSNIFRKDAIDTTKSEFGFSIPESFVAPFGHKICADFLARNHCLTAIVSGCADVRYDVARNRAVFIIYDEGKVVGAVGRALNWKDKPKWWRYDTSEIFYTVRNSNSNLRMDGNCGVVVEDAASACAVSAAGYHGLALLGSTLRIPLIDKLRTFNRILIALDPDATGKAIDMRNRLCYYLGDKVELRAMPDDPKYYSSLQLKEILR